MARRATSLGPKPSSFVFVFFCLFFCFFPFPFFVFSKNPCSPLKRALSCLFLSVSLSFSLAFFGLPLFYFLFLCLSLFLSSFFLLVFLFCFLLVPCFCLFLSFVSSLFLFHEKSNIEILNSKVFVHQSFLMIVGFLSSFSCQSPFLIFAFSYSMFCFLFNINFFSEKKTS